LPQSAELMRVPDVEQGSQVAQSSFDPFGEAVAGSDSRPDRRISASRVAWLGCALFWILVVIVVGARAIYYVPAFP